MRLHLPGDSAAGAVVIKGPGAPPEWNTYDPEITALEDAVIIWIDALKGPVHQFVRDRGHVQSRDNALFAIQRAIEEFNRSLKELSDKIYRRTE